MGRCLQLCLTTLLVLASFPQANNLAVVDKAETCFRQNQPCSFQNVTCSDGARIVILDEQHAFNDSTTTCTDGCSVECCQEGNFKCIHGVNEKTFGRTFSNCWNKTQCQYQPLQETRVFTSNNTCNGSSVFGVLKYRCINETSVRDFTDPTPVVGHLLMAIFSPFPRAYPACVSPDSTLECLVESDQGGNGSRYRVMLVMNHSTPGNCSKLHVTARSYKSADMPCRHSTEYRFVDNIYLQTQVYFVLQLSNVKDEAWAVVQSAHVLTMTCGKTRSIITAAPETSSNLPPSSIDVVSQPASTPTSALGATSTDTAASESPPNVAAIVGGVIGGVMVLIVIVVVVVIVCRRQRGPEPKAEAHRPEQGLAMANSAYEGWDLDGGDGRGGAANGSTSTSAKVQVDPAQRPVTDEYAKVNKKSTRVAYPSQSSTGFQPNRLPAFPAPGEVTDVYSRPKKSGKKHPDIEDNSADITSLEDASSPAVIPPRLFNSSDSSRYNMADSNAPEGHHAEYDHLGQKRRPVAQPGDVMYGHLGDKMAADDPEASYDRLRSGGRRAGDPPGPPVSGSHVYGHLGTEGAPEEEDDDSLPYDRLGGAGRRDVIKDGVYHVASQDDTDPYSEHEPNFF